MKTKPQKETHPFKQGLLTGYLARTKNYRVWRSKGTDDWLLIHTVSGRGRFGFKSGNASATAGDVVLLRPGTLHDYGLADTPGRWAIWWAHFLPEPDWLEWLQWPEEAPGIMKVSMPVGRPRHEITACLSTMHRFATGGQRLHQKLAMNALEGALLRCASRMRDTSERFDPRIRQAQLFLAGHLAGAFSLEQTARHVALSPSRLAHLFRQVTGETPRSYHERLKINRAIELLGRTGQSVSEIGYQLGFESAFYFSRRFKLATGTSPRIFRETFAGE